MLQHYVCADYMQTFCSLALNMSQNLHPIFLEEEFVRAEQLPARRGADRLRFLTRVVFFWLVVFGTGGGLVQENLEYPQYNMYSSSLQKIDTSTIYSAD